MPVVGDPSFCKMIVDVSQKGHTMLDPTFKDRAGLEVWRMETEKFLLGEAAIGRPCFRLREQKARVVAAHAHLMEETPHGR